MKEHREKESEAEARRRDLEEQEDEAISQIGAVNVRTTLKRLGNSLTANFGVNLFDTEEDSPEKRLKYSDKIDLTPWKLRT